jgi:hypothetical protein
MNILTEQDLDLEIKWKEEQLPALVKAFPEKIVAVAVRKALQLRMVNVRKMREKCYEAYEELRKNGVPLLERRKALNLSKVEWCDRIEAELLTHLKSVRIRPHSEWLWRGDYERMKRMGFNWFIQFEMSFRNITY